MNSVQFGGDKMNKIVTSKEDILKASREIASKDGLQSINMRNVAKHCGVAVGSIYNYFPSKADLIIATVEDIWKSFFHMGDDLYFKHFNDCVDWLFTTIQRGTKQYPGFFIAHAQGFQSSDVKQGREVMEEYFKHIQRSLLMVLNHDQQVKQDVFNDDYTKEDFIQFVFVNIMNLLSQQQPSCHILLETIQRVIY
ncbi:MAG: TetR/AcrR family transcriptional regulator [Coprobacillus cateniformis]|nr:TetR/AcrR family transcriptional regulator [Coprobacillus cateniformis]